MVLFKHYVQEFALDQMSGVFIISQLQLQLQLQFKSKFIFTEPETRRPRACEKIVYINSAHRSKRDGHEDFPNK